MADSPKTPNGGLSAVHFVETPRDRCSGAEFHTRGPYSSMMHLDAAVIIRKVQVSISSL
jgi:hypothetical protein